MERAEAHSAIVEMNTPTDDNTDVDSLSDGFGQIPNLALVHARVLPIQPDCPCCSRACQQLCFKLSFGGPVTGRTAFCGEHCWPDDAAVSSPAFYQVFSTGTPSASFSSGAAQVAPDGKVSVSLQKSDFDGFAEELSWLCWVCQVIVFISAVTVELSDCVSRMHRTGNKGRISTQTWVGGWKSCWTALSGLGSNPCAPPPPRILLPESR
jgi:hypothetical protein